MTDFDRFMIKIASQSRSIYDFTKNCDIEDLITMINEYELLPVGGKAIDYVYRYFLRLMYIYSEDYEVVDLIYPFLDTVERIAEPEN